MLLQGSLQVVFDALFEMGVIDPVLEMDWGAALEEIEGHVNEIEKVVEVCNRNQSGVDGLIAELGKFDDKTLGYLAMEVAREFADFHSRENLH